MIDYMEEVKIGISEEFMNFRKETLSKTKEEIFDDYYKIYFMNEISDFLIVFDKNMIDEKHWKSLYEDNGSLLNLLYDYYLKNEYATISTTEDIIDFICNYNKTYHRETLYSDMEM